MGAEQTAAAQPDALIASDRVEGTAVFGPDHRRIGRIERLMIDKTTGQVAYAVLSFGGFLGIGEDHYPLPWATLDYDTTLDGYRIDVTEQQLRDAPKFGKNDYWDWSGRHEQVHKHYGVDPIWY
jgi:PRC-barrel domain